MLWLSCNLWNFPCFRRRQLSNMFIMSITSPYQPPGTVLIIIGLRSEHWNCVWDHVHREDESSERKILANESAACGACGACAKLWGRYCVWRAVPWRVRGRDWNEKLISPGQVRRSQHDQAAVFNVKPLIVCLPVFQISRILYYENG